MTDLPRILGEPREDPIQADGVVEMADEPVEARTGPFTRVVASRDDSVFGVATWWHDVAPSKPVQPEVSQHQPLSRRFVTAGSPVEHLRNSAANKPLDAPLRGFDPLVEQGGELRRLEQRMTPNPLDQQFLVSVGRQRECSQPFSLVACVGQSIGVPACEVAKT